MRCGVTSTLAYVPLSRFLTPTCPTTPNKLRAPVLLPGELVVFHSRVEARSPKRRGSRLRLPLSVVSPTRPKARELVLTNYRLLCVKRKVNPLGNSNGGLPSSKAGNIMGPGIGVRGMGNIPKTSGGGWGGKNGKDTDVSSVIFTVKSELALGMYIDVRGKDQKDGREKDKETRSVVESAARKSDREFVVLTVSSLTK